MTLGSHRSCMAPGRRLHAIPLPELSDLRATAVAFPTVGLRVHGLFGGKGLSMN